MGCFLLSSCFWSNTPPRAKPDASTSTSNDLSSWGCRSTGLLVTRSCNMLNATSCLSSHTKGVSLQVSLLRGFAVLGNPGIKEQ